MSPVSEHRERIAFYRTIPHRCGYLPDRQAVNIVADPELQVDKRIYGWLAAQGFRRSGRYLYRPECPGCAACVPLRVPVAEFRPDRGQQRAWRRNSDLAVSEVEPCYNDEHFELYRRYLNVRHAGGGMDDPDAEDYVSFLTCPGITTRFYDFRLGGRCVALAVVDVLDDALSAVYTFFDPDCAWRSLGTYAILWEIEQARRLARRWLYMGYWIEECGKMSYKRCYVPHELFVGGRWRRQETKNT